MTEFAEHVTQGLRRAGALLWAHLADGGRVPGPHWTATAAAMGLDENLKPLAATRIKSYRMRHDWQITGTGRIEEFPTASARCQRCGEEANGFTAPLDEFMVRRGFGCWRDGFDGRYQRDDLVKVGGRLDYFVNYLPDGRCATGNLGGGTYVQDVADLVAVV